jgi:hypothetical protein
VNTTALGFRVGTAFGVQFGGHQQSVNLNPSDLFVPAVCMNDHFERMIKHMIKQGFLKILL